MGRWEGRERWGGKERRREGVREGMGERGSKETQATGERRMDDHVN